MPPTVKYSLGRIGLVLVVFAVLIPVPELDMLVKLMIAIITGSILQFFLLKKWRREMIAYIDDSVAKSRARKEELRAALAGEEAAPADDETSPAGEEAVAPVQERQAS